MGRLVIGAIGLFAVVTACGGDSRDAAAGGAAGAAGVGAGGSAGTAGLDGSAAAPGGGAGTDAGADSEAPADAAPDSAFEAGDAAPSCGPNVPFGAPATCVACVESECCAQMAACGDEPDCIALRSCGGKPGCSSGPCWLQCIKDHAKGYPVASVFHSCMAKACQPSCGGTPGSCGLAVSPTPSTCAPCLQAKCCADMYAASQSLDYWRFFHCRLVQCPTFESSCVLACAAQEPAGASAEQTISSCLSAHCAAECA